METLTIEISQISERQKKLFLKLFTSMMVMGSIGTSREIKLFCDGDGGFRPMFKVGGEIIPVPVIEEGEDKGCLHPDTYEKPNVCFD